MNRETQPDVIRYDRAGDGIVTLTLDNPGKSANMMNTAFRTSLEHCIDRLEAERDTIKGVIVTSAKETFLAGGDLSAILALAPGFALRAAVQTLAPMVSKTNQINERDECADELSLTLV